MARAPTRRSDCPIHFGLLHFGDRWSLLILRDLAFKGRDRFTEFKKAGEGIATNILADRLKRLEDDGLVEKHAADGGHARYLLTEKGIDLVPVLVEIIIWSSRHDPGTAADPDFVARAKADREVLVAEVQALLRERRDGDSSVRSE